MLIASKLIPSGAGLAPVLLRRAATIELDWDTRQKSRFDATDSQGRVIGVFLARGGRVRGGDVLVAEDGSLVVVRALPQAVLRVTACAHGSAHDLLRAAYHLGNRHVPLQVGKGFLRIAEDHVLEELARKLGARVSHVEAPFEPEAGAYGGGHQHDEMGHGGKIHDHHGHSH